MAEPEGAASRRGDSAPPPWRSAVRRPARQDPAYAKLWRLDRHRGITRLTDAAPVREHLTRLHHAGASWTGIADAAGVSSSAVHRIQRGYYRTVQRKTANALLTVDLARVIARPLPSGLVPKAGACRRIRALMTLGWTHAAMRDHCGIITHLVLSQSGEWICRRKHDAIADMYDALWRTLGPSRASAERAAKAGYPGPLAWDDDTIDDPAATPIGVASPTPLRSRHVVAEQAEDLARTRCGWGEAASRIGISEDGLEGALRRAGRPDLIGLLKTDPELRVLPSRAS